MTSQTAKSARTRARGAKTASDRTGTSRGAGRAGPADSGRCSPPFTAVLSLGPGGLRLEPSPAEATLARLAEVWAEYDELTRAEWHCDRATALRSQIRKLLGGDR